MRPLKIIVLALSGILLSGFAEHLMTVAEFNDVVGKTSAVASFADPNVRLAWASYGEALDAARKEEADARGSGGSPPFCIPVKTTITRKDVIEHMRALSTSEQRQLLVAAVHTWMVQKYPCIAGLDSK